MIYIKQFLNNNKVRAAALFSAAAIIILALLSYDRNDPSFNVAVDKQQNFLQYFNSHIADLFYRIIGYSAFIIPLCLLAWSYQLYSKGYIKLAFLRFISMIFSVCTACYALSSLAANISFVTELGILGTGLKYLIAQVRLLDSPIVKFIDPYMAYAPLVSAFVSIVSLVFALGIKTKIYINICKYVCNFLLFTIKKINIFSKLSIPKIKIFDHSDSDAYYTAEEFDYLNDTEAGVQNKEFVETVKKLTVKDKKIISLNNEQREHKNSDSLIPPIELLADGNNQSIKPQTQDELRQRSESLIAVLNDFGVKGAIISIKEGPVVTMYEFEPAPGTKSSRVIGLADDIARSLSAVSTRIAVIPGRNALGIELPNKTRMFFCLKELIKTHEFKDSSVSLPLILGKDLGGAPMIVDLAKMPHLLVAGTTGSGKSVAINAMIMSLLYKYTPEDCRMIMIDPKMLELSAYDNIPHLLTPVVTEPGKAIVALKWAVKEMENRYRLMSHLGVRNITNYNVKLLEAKNNNLKLERKIQTGFDPETGKPIFDNVPIDMNKMPFIVVIVDEMADLMLVAGKDIETSIQRLAQMARAAGIHIIMATQRPSVDIITGVIKANFPSRISFKVTSRIDSRTILGEQGSEQLLGMGDMLYMGSSSKILRVHGPFVDDSEVEKVTNFLRSTGSPEYVSAVTESLEDEMFAGIDDGDIDNNIYTQAVNIVKNERKASISYIQRCLRIGYNRAATLVEEMEKRGVLGPANQSGKREILLPEN